MNGSVQQLVRNSYRTLQRQVLPLFGGSLTAEQILDKVYPSLTQRKGVQKFSFVTGHDLQETAKDHLRVHFAIADDSDDHRSRTGYMSYEAAHLVPFGQQPWLLAKGTKTGDYPGNEYAADIFAVKADQLQLETPEKNVHDIVREYMREQMKKEREDAHRLGIFPAPPFLASLLVAHSWEGGGGFTFPTWSLGHHLGMNIKQQLAEMEMQKTKRDERYLSANDLQPAVVGEARYAPAAVRVLIEGIEKILSGNYDRELSR